MFYLNDQYDTHTRFDLMKFVDINGKDWYDPLTSFFLINLPKLPHVEEYIITYEIGRPDLLADRFYQDTQYWWIVMLYNNILNVNDLQAGVSIRRPAKELIDDLYIQASTLKKATENDNN